MGELQSNLNDFEHSHGVCYKFPQGDDMVGGLPILGTCEPLR